MTRKKIVPIVALFALLLITVVSHHFLICLGAKSYLSARLPKGGKLNFDYQTAHFEEGQFVLHGVIIQREEKEGSPGFDVQVDDLKFAFDLRLLPFKFKPRVVFDHPQVALMAGDIKAVEQKKTLYQTLDKHLFRTPIKIRQGELFFGDRKAIISFENPEEGNPGKLSLFDKVGADPSFCASFTKENHQLHFDMTFNRLDAPWIFEISRYFFPTIPDELTVEGGRLDGELSFSMAAPKSIDFVKYSLNLDEFALTHAKYGVVLGVHHLGWKEHFTSSEEMGEMGTHPFFEKVWPYFIGDGELSGLNVRIDDHWVASDVRGTVRFSQKSEPIINLLGTYAHNETDHPFQITGEGFIEEDAFWKIAFDVNFLTETNPQAYFAVTSQGDRCYLIQTEFFHVRTDILNLCQHLIGSHIPSARALTFEEGIFAGKMQGWVEEKKLTRCEVIHFEAMDAILSLPSEKLAWQAQKVKGRGEFELSTPDFFDGTFWEVDVSEGALCLGKKLSIDALDFHIAMHDQYIKPSKLKGQMEGVEGQVEFEGLYTHLNLAVDLDLKPDELSHYLGLKKSKELKEEVALDLDLHLKTVGERMAVEGTLGVIHGDDHKDTIRFGWNWNLIKLWMGDFKQALDLGWFKALGMSDRTLNLPLMFWNKDWRGEGSVNVDGTFNSHAVEFSIDPTRLIYKSPAIDIIPQIKGEEKAPNGTFYFDFDNQMWRGKLPLKGVRLKEHSFGIEFDSFTSELDLEGNEFLFQNVDATANGVRFQAEMGLDYTRADRNELTINTYQIDGQAGDVISFLRHFKLFQTVDFPLEGTIKSGPGEMHLRAFVGDVEELLEWKIALHFNEGRLPFSETLAFENLAGDLFFSAEDQLFKINNAAGQLLLSAGQVTKSYELNIPLFELDAVNGVWDYDLRLEAPTHDICRIAGEAHKENGALNFVLNHDRTRLFGAKIDVSQLSFTDEGAFNEVDLKATLSALDLFHHVDFLTSAGLTPLKPITIHEMRTTKFEGEVNLSLTLNREKEVLTFDAKSDRLLCGPLDLDHLAIHGKREGDHILLDQFEAGSLWMKASMNRMRHEWTMPQFEIAWKKCYLKGGEGHYQEESKKLKLPLDGLKVNLSELSTLFPPSEIDWSYLTGTLFATGEFVFDLSSGIRNLSFDSAIKVIGEDFGKGKLRLESPETLQLSFDTEHGFELKEANFNFLHPKSNQLWAKCHFDSLSYIGEEWNGENFLLVVPPEMIQFLGQTHSLPHLGYEEERLLLFERPLKWDNQMEAQMEFSIGKNSRAKGRLKEGYYWIGDKAWYLNDFAFTYENSTFDLKLNTLFDEMPFDLKAHLSFLPHFSSEIVIQETFHEERGSDDPLVIKTSWNEQEGFYIRSMDGQVCGLDFDFHHNPRESFLDQAVLTGQLKVNVPALAKLLPDHLQETIKEFEIGKGYELSGDLVFSKLQPEDSYFIGYLKGKNFQLMGSVMETLMSEIAIHPNHIELANFNLSDSSGLFNMEVVRLEKMQDERWGLVIPEIAIQDFRPSLLKKIGKYPGRIKPLTIRELQFHNIRGYLGEAESFTGKGELNFINTFKRDYNLLDIPFEILGRLGLDMGLLVPVRGDLNFIMVDGRVYLTELSHSYSEGKRSQFYLSPSERSFIDFDGNLNINIKMKQYVLLKITEPFTLSIAGTFENPKYGLK